MKKKIILYVFVLICVGFLTYHFAYRTIAKINIQKYMTAQGISAEDILEKEFYFDIKMGGYTNKVIFKTCPDETYKYWFNFNRDKGPYHIFLSINKEGSGGYATLDGYFPDIKEYAHYKPL